MLKLISILFISSLCFSQTVINPRRADVINPPVGGTPVQDSTTQSADGVQLTTGFDGNFNETGQPATNAYAQDDTYASTDYSDKRNKEYATLWTFDFSGVPAGSTIDSVRVYVDRYVDVDNGVAHWKSAVYADVTAVDPLGTLGGTGSIGPYQYDTADNPTTDTDTYMSYAMDANPSLAQLQGANFGVRVQYENNNSGTDCEAFIDHVYMKVWYTYTE